MRFMHSGNIFKLLSNLFPIEILHSRQELTQACEPESEQSNLPTMRKSRSSWKCNRWGTSGEAQIQLDTISRSLSLSFHHTVISSPFFRIQEHSRIPFGVDIYETGEKQWLQPQLQQLWQASGIKKNMIGLTNKRRGRMRISGRVQPVHSSSIHRGREGWLRMIKSTAKKTQYQYFLSHNSFDRLNNRADPLLRNGKFYPPENWFSSNCLTSVTLRELIFLSGQ